MQNENWVGWYGTAATWGYTIPVGGSATFDYATQYRTSTDITAMTMWISTCKGDGNIFGCSLTGGNIPLAGGVLLSAPTNQ
jgi:hypothetical protein